MQICNRQIDYIDSQQNEWKKENYFFLPSSTSHAADC